MAVSQDAGIPLYLVGRYRPLFFELFGVHRPTRYESPAVAGDYNHALHVDHPDAPSLLEQYLDHPALKVGGAPKETAAAAED